VLAFLNSQAFFDLARPPTRVATTTGQRATLWLFFEKGHVLLARPARAAGVSVMLIPVLFEATPHVSVSLVTAKCA
jgi:hypothetical protein